MVFGGWVASGGINHLEESQIKARWRESYPRGSIAMREYDVVDESKFVKWRAKAVMTFPKHNREIFEERTFSKAVEKYSKK